MKRFNLFLVLLFVVGLTAGLRDTSHPTRSITAGGRQPLLSATRFSPWQSRSQARNRWHDDGAPGLSAAASYTVSLPFVTVTNSMPISVSFPEVSDAVYHQSGDVITVTIPYGPCTRVSSSPIQVGDFIVWSMYDQLSGCSGSSPYATSLLGYHIRNGKLYQLAQSGSSEATLLHQPDAGLVFQNIVFGGSTVSALDTDTFSKTYGTPQGFRATSDASGIYLNGLYYFGTINPPGNICQNPVNPNCGGIFALNTSGDLVYSLDLTDNFRSWIGAGLTTDGQYIYAGGSEQYLGSSSSQYLYGCSVVKLDQQLNIVAAFDPGDQGCHRSGAGQNDEDAVAGEVVIAGDGTLWVNFSHGVDDRNVFALYHLNSDLTQICAFEGPSGTLLMTGYYQAPTVDKDGNVYLFISPSGVGNGLSQLWKVTPTCQGAKLADLSQSGSSTPVLADDQYLLVVSGGQLQIRTLNGSIFATYPLATSAKVIASPMIANGVIYIVDTTGALTVIHNSGLQGYGTAPWPRYRHDNAGSGAQ